MPGARVALIHRELEVVWWALQDSNLRPTDYESVPEAEPGGVRLKTWRFLGPCRLLTEVSGTRIRTEHGQSHRTAARAGIGGRGRSTEERDERLDPAEFW